MAKPVEQGQQLMTQPSQAKLNLTINQSWFMISNNIKLTKFQPQRSMEGIISSWLITYVFYKISMFFQNLLQLD